MPFSSDLFPSVQGSHRPSARRRICAEGRSKSHGNPWADPKAMEILAVSFEHLPQTVLGRVKCNLANDSYLIGLP